MIGIWAPQSSTRHAVTWRKSKRRFRRLLKAHRMPKLLSKHWVDVVLPPVSNLVQFHVELSSISPEQLQSPLLNLSIDSMPYMYNVSREFVTHQGGGPSTESLMYIHQIAFRPANSLFRIHVTFDLLSSYHTLLLTATATSAFPSVSYHVLNRRLQAGKQRASGYQPPIHHVAIIDQQAPHK